MGKLKETEYKSKIDFSDVKHGQFITIRGHKTPYIVLLKGKSFVIIPVIVEKSQLANTDTMIITNVFDAKNGNCLIRLKD